VRALGKGAAESRAEELRAAALAELEALGDNAGSLRELVNFAVRRKR